jgi:hypothetical protein
MMEPGPMTGYRSYNTAGNRELRTPGAECILVNRWNTD